MNSLWRWIVAQGVLAFVVMIALRVFKGAAILGFGPMGWTFAAALILAATTGIAGSAMGLLARFVLPHPAPGVRLCGVVSIGLLLLLSAFMIFEA